MKHPMALIGLVLFLVVDVALLLAVREHLDDSQLASADESAVSSPASTPSGEPDPEAAGDPGLELSRSGVLAKVSRGRCTPDSTPLIEISTDQGATFTEVALPLLEEGDTTTVGAQVVTVRTIEHVRASSKDEIAMIGSDEACRPQQFVTRDGGTSWKRSEPKAVADPLDGWWVDASRTGVVSPQTATEPGCEVVALAPVSDRNAKVACSDGAIKGTNDFGEQWVQLGALDQVAGLVFDSVADGYALAADDECAVRLLTTGNAGGQWTPAGCIADQGQGAELVGSAARLYALVADDQVYVSTDAGIRWVPADQDDQ